MSWTSRYFPCAQFYQFKSKPQELPCFTEKMYNSRGYDDRRRGPYNEPNRGRGESNEYGRRDDYGGSSGMKRGSYSDHRGVDSGMFSSSAPKRSRDLDSMSGGGGYLDRSRGSGGGILDTPRLDRSLLLAEEERLRQLEEIAQLKREHELALLRLVLF